MPKVTVLLASFARPAKVGVYIDSTLVEEYTSDKNATESYYEIFAEIEKKYEIARLAYAKGPGSFMGLKLGFVFLSTLSIAKNLPFVACSSFNLTDDKPVFAHGKRWFVKTSDQVVISELNEPASKSIELPKSIDLSVFDSETLPEYILPAV